MAKSKRIENSVKHYTKEERERREQAEEEVIPAPELRAGLNPAKPPRMLAKDSAARRHWKHVLLRMQGLAILDDLDEEVLAVYCSMLSRHEALNKLCRQMIADSEQLDDTEARLEQLGKLDSLQSKIQKQEGSILQYAERLGLTPNGRVRLAQKRAEAAAMPQEEADLFGG